MMMSENLKRLTFRDIKTDDLIYLTDIMQRSFDNDTSIHTDLEKGGPKGYDDGSLIKKMVLDKEQYKKIVLYKDEIIGAFFIKINNHEGYLELLFIDPGYLSKGFGLEIWVYIENLFPTIRIWKTSTPGYSKRNHNFYVNKCQFKVYKITNSREFYNECYHLQKTY